MPTYNYTAITESGENISQSLDAPSLEVAQDILRNQNIIVISLQEARGSILSMDINIGGARVKAKEIVMFARQLSVLISATVPIVRSLRILAKQATSKTMQKTITDIAQEVDGGARLSAAMKQHDSIFDDFFVYMIRAGETTGRLDEVLVYLADQKEKDYKLMSKIIGSMIYPAFIITVLIGIFIFMLVYVVPQLLEVVNQSAAELPTVTKLLIGISDFAQNFWWFFIVLVVGAVAGYMSALRFPQGKLFVDRARLHVPIIGKIFRNIYLSRIARSMSNLLAAGVPVNKSIVIVSDIVGNAHYKKILLRAKNDIEGGNTVSHSFAQTTYIPQMMTQMMAVGEETGRSDQILEKVADFYMNEVDTLTQALASLIEPIIIIIIGIGAAILVSGILLPMYTITGQI